ncbi:MAG: hypothetical protein ACOYBY_04355 [Dermatophilaceae bacterium]
MSMDWSGMVVALFRVLLAGLVFGAAVPALFAVGVSWWAKGTDDVAADGAIVHKGNPAALAASWLAFAVVIGAVLLGILWITQKSLHHYFGFPMFGS